MITTLTKRKIIHQCYCRDCDLAWDSRDVRSVCPYCGKTIIAKIMIVREEKKTEVDNE